MARAFPLLEVGAVDATLHRGVAHKFGVAGVPSLVLFQNNKMVAKLNDTEGERGVVLIDGGRKGRWENLVIVMKMIIYSPTLKLRCSTLVLKEIQAIRHSISSFYRHFFHYLHG